MPAFYCLLPALLLPLDNDCWLVTNDLTQLHTGYNAPIKISNTSSRPGYCKIRLEALLPRASCWQGVLEDVTYRSQPVDKETTPYTGIGPGESRLFDFYIPKSVPARYRTAQLRIRVVGLYEANQPEQTFFTSQPFTIRN
jgi:hypothetical protein